MIIFLILLAFLVVFILFYTRQPKFGSTSHGNRLAIIRNSSHFRNGKFQNLNPTPELTEGYGMMGVMYEFLFKKTPGRKPASAIPSIKTDLKDLDPAVDVLVWFGHSSYFMQLDGKRILVDPVLSGNASPLPGSNKAFKGTDIYTVDDLPFIDYLFITHDHYDHADYDTLIRLRSKTAKVICGLGVGAHLERWGYDAKIIYERDWFDEIITGDGFLIYVTPARHFSGRSFSRCNTLWVSFVLQSSSTKIYMGGDSGYDSHFADIGNRYGPFDLAILDNGQYDVKWKYIHMQPGEVLQAATDLRAKKLFPVHSGKFVMANHAWDEPLKRITELNKEYKIPLITPVIGEKVVLKDESRLFPAWWTGVT